MDKIWTQWLNKVQTIEGIEINENADLKHRSTFANASRAQFLISIHDQHALQKLIVVLNEFNFIWKQDWDVLGKGSNILFLDEGYLGCLIDLSPAYANFSCIDENENEKIYQVGAGLANIVLLNHLRKQNLQGFGYAFGIPGSIGGGVRMNAGTPLGWFSQNVKEVIGYTSKGALKKLSVTEDDFEYRNFKHGHDLLITEVVMSFKRCKDKGIEYEVAMAKDSRKTQPLQKPNFGSVFKNPQPLYAAALIEKAKLKGKSMGGAQISNLHANFIVNLGSGTCSDALALIELAKKTVYNEFKVNLQEEVKIMGRA